MFRRVRDEYNARKGRVQRLLREGTWIVVGQASSFLGSLVLVRVLTTNLGPEQYGRLGLALTVVSLLHQVLLGGFIGSVSRFYTVAYDQNDLSGYIQAARKLFGTVTLVVCGLAVLLATVLLTVNEWESLLILLGAGLLSLLSGYNAAMNALQNAARRRSAVAFHTALDAWLRVVFALAVLAWLGPTGEAVILGYSASVCVSLISQSYFLRRLVTSNALEPRERVDDRWVLEMWGFAWPVMAGGLFNWGYYASQRWALEVSVSTEEVGRFFALTQVAYTPVALAGSLFLSFISPIVYSRAGSALDRGALEKARTLVARCAIFGLVAVFSLAGLVGYYHGAIFAIFVVGAGFGDLSSYMPMVVLAAGLLQVSLLLAVQTAAENQTKRLLPLNIGGNCIIATLNFLATAWFGMRGLLLSMVVGAVVHLVWNGVLFWASARESRGAFRRS